MAVSPRVPARVLAPAAALALVLALMPFTGAAAQVETEVTREFCTVGRPQPSCEKVLVAQFTWYPRIQRFGEVDSPIEWELGVLVNRGATQAIGATIVLGADGEGLRTALKGRYRRWIGRYMALDASGGLAYARRDPVDPASFTTDPAFGLTGDLAVGLTDWISLGVRGDLLWSGLAREPARVTYGSVRLGTTPGIVAGLLALLAFGAVAGSL
jgi:hypothetical protein